MTKQIKLLTKNNSRTAEAKAKKYLFALFSKNQIDLIMKKKKEFIGLPMTFQKHLL